MEILAVENLSFSYPKTVNAALSSVSFSVDRGDFVTVCGATGSGKSTLLRMLKREITPLGEKSGSVFRSGTLLSELDDRTSACSTGFVAQNPEQQTVTDKVWHELAFGLENMGIPNDTIRRRVAEICGYFGIEEWFDRDVSELSGGQKQLLNLASVMVMQPDILLLDEPTSQLDPIAASDFFATLSKLNRELSLTIIIVEHRLEEVLPLSNKLLVLENGTLLAFGDTKKTVAFMRGREELLEGMPAAVRIFTALNGAEECPLNVREGRNFIEDNYKNDIKSLKRPEYTHSDKPALEFRDTYFRYSKNEPDVLCGLDFTVFEGEIFFILGGNGSGKSTALCVASGIYRPYSGYVKVFGKKLKEYKNGTLYRECLALLPQDVQTVFLRNTVKEELEDVKTQPGSLPFDLSPLSEKHPYDLSGGQQQLVALAKVLASKPRLLLLDEPTKGLDAHSKKTVAEILKKLKNAGAAVVVVSHDVEFAASCADRCAMFFRGEITSCDTPVKFFSENNFYTTSANRMTRGYFDDAVTADDVVKLCSDNGRRCDA